MIFPPASGDCIAPNAANLASMILRLTRFAALLLASAVLPSCAPVDALNASVPTDRLIIDTGLPYMDGAMGRLDVYRPASATAGHMLPLVVFIHGGAWKSGDRTQYRFAAAPLAQAGMVVVVPDYRKVPQVHFPAFLEDNARAIAFARAHATEWGADPARIFLIGHSAGGYNALMLGLDPHYLAAVGMRPQDLAGVVGIAAPADFLPSTDPDVIDAFGPSPDPAHAQPIAFAAADAPPLLLLHGDKDDTVYPRNAVSLEKHMRTVGGRVEVRRFAALGHVGIITAFAPLFAWRAPVLASVLDFVRDH